MFLKQKCVQYSTVIWPYIFHLFNTVFIKIFVLILTVVFYIYFHISQYIFRIYFFNLLPKHKAKNFLHYIFFFLIFLFKYSYAYYYLFVFHVNELQLQHKIEVSSITFYQSIYVQKWFFILLIQCWINKIKCVQAVHWNLNS